MGRRRSVRIHGLEYQPGQPHVPGTEPSKMNLPKYKPPKPPTPKKRKK